MQEFIARQIGQQRPGRWTDVDVGGAASDVAAVKTRAHQLEACVDGVARRETLGPQPIAVRGKDRVALRHRRVVVVAGGGDVGERHEPAGEHLRVGCEAVEETGGCVESVRLQPGSKCEREPVVYESGFSGKDPFHPYLQAGALRR